MLPPIRSRLRALLAGLAVSLAACADDGPPPTDPDPADELRKACERLASHVVDVRLAKLPSASAHHRRAASNAVGPGFVETCLDELPPEQVRCALAASDDAGLAACLDLEFAEELTPTGGQ